MALFQGTLFFESGKFGWSETYGLDAADVESATGVFRLLQLARKDLLGENAQITYRRVYSADPNNGESYLKAVAFKDGVPDPNHGLSDRPYSAVLCDLSLEGNKKGRIFMRGVPDDMITQGHGNPTGFSPSASWINAFDDFNFALVGNSFRRIKVTRTNPGSTPPAYDITSSLIQKVEYKKAVSRNTGRPIELPRGRRFAHRTT